MSGLQPSGLGRSGSFGASDHEKLFTDRQADRIGYICPGHDVQTRLNELIADPAISMIVLTDEFAVDGGITIDTGLDPSGNGMRKYVITGLGSGGIENDTSGPILEIDVTDGPFYSCNVRDMKLSGGTTDQGLLFSEDSGNNAVNQCSFDNLVIGGGIGNAPQGNGFEMTTKMYESTFANCRIVGAGNHGWYLVPPSDEGISQMYFERCKSQRATNAGMFVGPVSKSTFVGCEMNDSGGRGWQVAGGNYPAMFIGCDAEGNTGDGWRVASGGKTFSQCGAGHNAIGMNVKGSYNIIEGGRFESPDADGLRLDGSFNEYRGSKIMYDNVTLAGATDLNWKAQGKTFNQAAATDRNDSGKITISFDTPFTSPPILTFARRGDGINGINYTTNGAGEYDGATVSISTAGGTIDWNAAPQELV